MAGGAALGREQRRAVERRRLVAGIRSCHGSYERQRSAATAAAAAYTATRGGITTGAVLAARRWRRVRRTSNAASPASPTASDAVPHWATFHAQLDPPSDGDVTSSVPRSASTNWPVTFQVCSPSFGQRDRGDVVPGGALLSRLEAVMRTGWAGHDDGEVVGALGRDAVAKHGEADLGVLPGIDGGHLVERDDHPTAGR